jgi:hypothetical protein
MAKPTNTIKGFIEIKWDGKVTLLSISNILAVRKDGDRTSIVIKEIIDNYGNATEKIDLTYEEVLALLREAAR